MTDLDTIRARAGRWLPLAVVFMIILAYSNSFSSPFIFDDYQSIAPDSWMSQVWPPNSRMIAKLTFRFNYAAAGVNVADYHLTNLLIHVAAALLLYGVVRRTLLLGIFSGKYGTSAAWLAGASAAIWGVHPLNTGSVTYVCQRYESLMGLFLLLVLYCFIRMHDSRHARSWGNCALVACILGMGTKEVMVVTPLLILLYDYLFVGPSLREILRLRRMFYLGLFATWGIFAALWAFTLSAAAERGMTAVSGAAPLGYFMTQAGVVLHYLRLAILPAGLCFDYCDWPPGAGLPGTILTGLPVLFLAGATLWAAVRRCRIAYLGLWFFIILSPTSTVVPLTDYAAEHRMYLPLAGVVVLAVLAVHGGAMALQKRFAWNREIVNKGLVVACLVAAAGLTAASISRNNVYQSERGVWEATLRERPGNLRAVLGVGSALQKEGKITEARSCYERILRQVSSGAVSIAEGYRDTLRASALNNLGAIHETAGSNDLAEACFREALGISGDFLDARNNLGIVLNKTKRQEAAIREWSATLSRSPGNAQANYCMGIARLGQGNCAEAAAHFRRAAGSDPNMIAARLNLAWLLATCDDARVRDGKEAVRLAANLCGDLGSQSAQGLDVLGAAYAEAGRFEEAIQSGTAALTLAQSRGLNAGAIAARIAGYRKGIAHRERCGKGTDSSFTGNEAR